MNLTTDFGEIESVIQQKIDQNRGKVRVAADLSDEGHRRDQGRGADAERDWPSRRSHEFEVELGLQVAGDDASRADRQGPRARRREGSRRRRTETRQRRTALNAR